MPCNEDSCSCNGVSSCDAHCSGHVAPCSTNTTCSSNDPPYDLTNSGGQGQVVKAEHIRNLLNAIQADLTRSDRRAKYWNPDDAFLKLPQVGELIRQEDFSQAVDVLTEVSGSYGYSSYICSCDSDCPCESNCGKDAGDCHQHADTDSTSFDCTCDSEGCLDEYNELSYSPDSLTPSQFDDKFHSLRGKPVSFSDIDQLRSSIADMVEDCVCDSNTCTCHEQTCSGYCACDNHWW